MTGIKKGDKVVNYNGLRLEVFNCGFSIARHYGQGKYLRRKIREYTARMAEPSHAGHGKPVAGGQSYGLSSGLSTASHKPPGRFGSERPATGLET